MARPYKNKYQPTTSVDKVKPNQKGNYTFYTVYGPVGFVYESLSYDRAMDALDDTFREHQRIHGSKWSEGKVAPPYHGYIVKRCGIKETVMPYVALEREDQPEEDDYEDYV